MQSSEPPFLGQDAISEPPDTASTWAAASGPRECSPRTGLLIGALLGGFLCNVLHISIGGGLIGALIIATLGAILFLFLPKFIKTKM